MFEQRFMDGTPVPPEYTAKVNQLIAQALEAEAHFPLDELEAAANAAKEVNREQS